MYRMSYASVNQHFQGKVEETPRKVISFSSSEDQSIKLHESPNPWRPLRKCDIPLGEKDRIKRSIQGVLNKLTPQKFETLLSQLKCVNIDTEEKLSLLIDLIFERAVNEPQFSIPYANLSKHLALIKVPVSGTSGTQVNFRKLLLTKCQKEFEQDRSDELKNEEKRNTFEVADPDKKKEMQLEYEEEEKKIRYRQLGNIRFIGELFKLGILIEPIMHECIKKLLSQGDEESLECLCRLLKTIGKELDDTKATKNFRDNQMDMYFAQMKGIVDKRLTSSRVRFLLQDVIDLKKNNWVPRRDESNPKTIHQIRIEMERTHTGWKRSDWASYSKSRKGGHGFAYASKLKLPKTDGVESSHMRPGERDLQSWNKDLAPNVPQYNEEEKERKIKPLMIEFRPNKNFEEAIKTVIELASPNTAHMFISAAVNEVIERSSDARYSLGQLLSSLLKKKIITFEQYKKGFISVIQTINDNALGTPLILEYMGEILEPMIEDFETPFKLLKEVLQPCIPSEKAGILVSYTLHCAVKRKGTINVGKVWRESDVKWTDIIGTDRNVAEFIVKHKLEFTVSQRQTQVSKEELRKHILNMLEKDSESTELFNWVNTNICDTSDAAFIHALVTAVHENCLSGSETTWELNTNKLKSRIPLISRYVSNDEKLQLQALYAVQTLMNQLGQPSGLLFQILDVLYDDAVINEESFLKWEKSVDSKEAVSKDVAVLSVKSFFTKLRKLEKETKETNSMCLLF